MLNVLRQFDALRADDIVDQRSLPAIAPTYATDSAFDGMPRQIADALHHRGVDRLYQHQADAIQEARNGSNVVLQLPLQAARH